MLPPVITQSLYFLVFGKFLGRQINNINGVDYMAFIIPGLIMMAIITGSYTNVVGSFFSSKFQRSVEELLVSPVPNGIIIAGYVAGGMLRGIMAGSLVFAVSIFFAKPVISDLGIIFVFMVLTAAMFALAGFTNAIFAKTFDDVSIFPTFVLAPLIYLGGVFYSISNLPAIWQNLSKFNPILYMVNGFRFGFYGFTDVSIMGSLFLLIFLIIGLTSVNLYLMKKGVGLRT